MADPRLISTQAPQGPGRGGPLVEEVSHLPDINQYGPDAELIAGPMQQWASAFEYHNRRPPTPQEAERHKLLLVSQGYSRMPDGSIRDVNAFNAKQRIDKATKLYNRLDEEYQDFEDSTFYKVGDAMSDAARVVLSPLIFLKKLGGEDTTNLLDPSARVRAGYSGSLSALQELAANNYNMVQDSAKLRDAERFARVKGETDLAKTRAEISGNPFGLEGQELSDYQYGTVSLGLDPNDVLNSMPEIRQQRQESEGKIIRIAGSPYRVELYNMGKEFGTKFDTENKEYKNAKQGYLKFLAAIDDNTGIGDMTALVQFIKTLDPTSVVREGEFAIAEASFGLFERLDAKLRSFESGERLSDTARQSLRSLATELIQSYDPIIEARYNKYSKRIGEIGFDDVGVDHFLGDRFQPIGAMPTEQTTTNNIPTPGERDGTDADTWR